MESCRNKHLLRFKVCAILNSTVRPHFVPFCSSQRTKHSCSAFLRVCTSTCVCRSVWRPEDNPRSYLPCELSLVWGLQIQLGCLLVNPRKDFLLTFFFFKFWDHKSIRPFHPAFCIALGINLRSYFLPGKHFTISHLPSPSPYPQCYSVAISLFSFCRFRDRVLCTKFGLYSPCVVV